LLLPFAAILDHRSEFDVDFRDLVASIEGLKQSRITSVSFPCRESDPLDGVETGRSEIDSGFTNSSFL
jgi:hypothetical protein